MREHPYRLMNPRGSMEKMGHRETSISEGKIAKTILTL
jgi:hypothetical protein